MKNILFFLTPKVDVIYTYSDQNVRQALERFKVRGYTALPIIDREGHYIGTLTEGDLLRAYLNNDGLLEETENLSISDIPRRIAVKPATISSNIEDLVQVAMSQNFVPVVDDDSIFIGIVTRQEIIRYYYNEMKKLQEEWK